MSLPISPEERYAKIREGVVALALLQRGGSRLVEEGFMDDAADCGEEQGQGAQALEYLRDVLHDMAEQHGIEALYCVFCGELVSSIEHSVEEIEDEAHEQCAGEHASP